MYSVTHKHNTETKLKVTKQEKRGDALNYFVL